MAVKILSNLYRAFTGPLLILLILSGAQETPETGLYPPIQFARNLAEQQTVEASSTCSSSSCISGCRVCNATCPHGSDLPSFVDLFTVGTAANGVVSQPPYKIAIQLS